MAAIPPTPRQHSSSVSVSTTKLSAVASRHLGAWADPHDPHVEAMLVVAAAVGGMRPSRAKANLREESSPRRPTGLRIAMVAPPP